MSATITASASLKHEQKPSNRLASRLYRCGWTTAITWPCAYRSRRRQHRGNLHRMMAVVVDDGNPVDFAAAGEAAVDAAEAGEGAGNDGVVDADGTGNGKGGQRVLDVVPAEHWQEHLGHGAAGAGLAVGDDGR